ncbi:S8 family peptidase [Burkholderia cepacia]|uniref:S8 family peptidase n=1 Tax=Burkholderia cepacia TaxID=292 RepID=UPI000CF0FC61|nr:S8 family peptidase [Burkholderia cepacia]KAB1590322.1 S8 family peptidase [Burkholderia cepacia]
MAHNPVQIVLNAQDYVRKADINPGGSIKDFYAGRNADFVEHRNALHAQVLGLRDAVQNIAPEEVFYAQVELQSDAWAKSHRPIKKVFPPGQQVYVGGGKLGSMVIELTPNDIPRIAAVVASAEAQVEDAVNKKGEIKPKPTRVRGEVGAIKSIRPYSAADRRNFSLDVASRWLADPRTGGAYYVETFVSPKSIDSRSSRPLKMRGERALANFERRLAILNLPIEVSKVADELVHASIYILKINPKIAANVDRVRQVHVALLNFLDNESVVKAILLPPILQANRAGGEFAPVSVIPPPENKQSYPIVGIIDSGVTNIPAIEAWSAGSVDFLDMAGQDVSHGSFIAGLVCASDTLNQDAIFAEGRCRFFDLGLHPTVAGAYENYYPRGFIDFLEQLDAEIPAAKDQGVRIFNMSLAVTTPVQHDGYSVFANMLDEIADKHDILFVLPSGNLDGALARPEWPSAPNDALAMLAGYRFQGQDGIFQPADSIRALVIGALDPRDGDGKFVPSQYTRRGPGPALGVKPDLAHVGGRFHQHSGLYSISPDGTGVQSCGTSYAAPLAAKTVAAVNHAIEGGVSREALSALIVHHAEVPEGLDAGVLKPIVKDFVGHGMPRAAAETLLAEDHEITMVFNGILKDGQELRFQFAWPASLVNEDGGCSGKVKLTLVYRPPIDRAFGGEFVRINLDTYLRQEVINPKTGAVSFQGRLKGDGSKRFERELVQHGAKWWPVKTLADEFDGVGHSSQWRLVIDPLARSNCTVPEAGIPFSAILTIASPDGATPIFNEMRQQLQNSGAQISDIRTALRPRVR